MDAVLRVSIFRRRKRRRRPELPRRRIVTRTTYLASNGGKGTLSQHGAAAPQQQLPFVDQKVAVLVHPYMYTGVNVNIRFWGYLRLYLLLILHEVYVESPWKSYSYSIVPLEVGIPDCIYKKENATSAESASERQHNSYTTIPAPEHTLYGTSTSTIPYEPLAQQIPSLLLTVT
eukprot:scaffold970_cov187-Amphora_coffeaeformis.AAC.3